VVIVLGLVTVVSTGLGGLFALRHQDRLHLILGLTAGVIVGVVAFDVLPEIVELSESTGIDFRYAMVTLAAGFLGFHAIEKWLLVHNAHEHEYSAGHHHPTVGVASALALIGHSMADGFAIGLAFQVDNTVGVAVAIAVIGHDFADGLNTVSLMLAHGNSRRKAAILLGFDCLAPLIGASLTLLFSVPDEALLLYLGAFAGFLLYIGASDILPEAHADHPSLATLGLTVTGVAAMYGVTELLP
jgi:zinc transporter ZupT